MSYRFPIFQTVTSWFRTPKKLSHETTPLPLGTVNNHDPLSNFVSDKAVLAPISWHHNHHEPKSLTPNKIKFKK